MENKKSSLSKEISHNIYGCDAIDNSKTIIDEIEEKLINGYSIHSSDIKPILYQDKFAASFKIDSKLTNCTFIGFNAGNEIKEGDGIVIIGDDIKNLNPKDNEDALFLGSKIAIGKTLFGVPINVVDVFENYLNITQGGMEDFIKARSNLNTLSKE